MLIAALLLQAAAASACPAAAGLSTWAQAKRCEALAKVAAQDWRPAGEAFEVAARAASGAIAADLWTQAGNAWLAAGDEPRAATALGEALAAGASLAPEVRGEILLDRARALVGSGDLPAARRDIDAALPAIGEDALAWLLSATLARRMNDVPRAQKDIAEALRRSPEEAPVQLEAGNIAALAGDAAAARAAWTTAARLAPDAPAGRAAAGALAQFSEQK